MRFEDRISTYLAAPSAPDLDAGWERVAVLCATLMAMLECGLMGLSLAQKIRREVRRAIHAAEQARRYTLKLHMLRLPDWRARVLMDLGGMERLLQLLQRLREPRVSVKRQRKPLSIAETERRARIKRFAIAAASPHIFRDPFRVDQDAQFRLPPLPRRPSQITTRDYEYSYDARPVTQLTGLNTPIMVWPEEFWVFMEDDIAPPNAEARGKSSPRRFPFLDKWLSALRAETAEVLPLNPFVKIKTARAPPYEGALLKPHHLPITAGGYRCWGSSFFHHCRARHGNPCDETATGLTFVLIETPCRVDNKYVRQSMTYGLPGQAGQ